MEKDNEVMKKIRRACCAVLIAIFWLAAENVDGTTVQAAPVSLDSSSAVVYGEADEESSAVANLIRGSTFDYQGDVTAEDGSVWYIITTADGVNGYIRGDIAFSSVDAWNGNEDISEETDEAAVSDEMVLAEETGTEDGNAAELEESAEEAADTADTAAPEDTGEDGEETMDDPVYSTENSRQKTYASDVLGAKIKETGNMSEEEEITETPEETAVSGGIDKTVVISVILLVCAIAAGIFFGKKMKREYEALKGDMGSLFGRTEQKYSKKSRRRRKKQRRKNKKKKLRAKK